ncbi:MAG: hypothetical protein K2X50_07685 [Gammaproteobacteria bacterium]|nr:hypothetical protein [Gammaproteobacteria bacterium]
MTYINELIKKEFSWNMDETFRYGFQYQGKIKENENIGCEIQIVPMLIGKYWEVEHFVLYKPLPLYKDIKKDCPEIKELYDKICETLEDFEKKFSEFVKNQKSRK